MRPVLCDIFQQILWHWTVDAFRFCRWIVRDYIAICRNTVLSWNACTLYVMRNEVQHQMNAWIIHLTQWFESTRHEGLKIKHTNSYIHTRTPKPPTLHSPSNPQLPAHSHAKPHNISEKCNHSSLCHLNNRKWPKANLRQNHTTLIRTQPASIVVRTLETFYSVKTPDHQKCEREGIKNLYKACSAFIFSALHSSWIL